MRLRSAWSPWPKTDDYRDQPDSVWEQPASSLSVGAVANVSAALEELATLDVFSPWIVERAFEGLPPHDVPERAIAYLQKHFAALCAFYADAASRGLAVIMWQG